MASGHRVRLLILLVASLCLCATVTAQWFGGRSSRADTADSEPAPAADESSRRKWWHLDNEPVEDLGAPSPTLFGGSRAAGQDEPTTTSQPWFAGLFPPFGFSSQPAKDASGAEEGLKPLNSSSLEGSNGRIICLFNDDIQSHQETNRATLLSDLRSAWRDRTAECREPFGSRFLSSLGIEIFTVQEEAQYGCLKDLLTPYQDMVTCTPSFLLTRIFQAQPTGFLGGILSNNAPSGDQQTVTTKKADGPMFAGANRGNKTTQREDFEWFRNANDVIFGGASQLQNVLKAYQQSDFAKKEEEQKKAAAEAEAAKANKNTGSGAVSTQAVGAGAIPFDQGALGDIANALPQQAIQELSPRAKEQLQVVSSFIGTGMDYFIKAMQGMAPTPLEGLAGAGGPGIGDVQQAVALSAEQESEVQQPHGRPSDNQAGGLFARNSREIPHNGIDDDGNGFVDDFIGHDFTKPPQQGGSGFSAATKDGSHDTAAGVLFAGNCQRKIDFTNLGSLAQGDGCNARRLGRAPRAMPLKVWSEERGGADLADVLTAIDYSVQRNASMAYLPLGFGDFPSLQQAKEGPRILRTAIHRASRHGHVFVIPCGNEGIQPQLQSTLNLKEYVETNLCDVPGAAVLCVCSIDSATGQPTDYTNIPLLTRNVLWAPGSLLSVDSSGNQTTLTGTSLAAASVLGTAAMAHAALGDVATPDLLFASLLSSEREVFAPGRPLSSDVAQELSQIQHSKAAARDATRRRMQAAAPAVSFVDIARGAANLASVAGPAIANALGTVQGQQAPPPAAPAAAGAAAPPAVPALAGAAGNGRLVQNLGRLVDPTASLLSGIAARNGIAPQGAASCLTKDTMLVGGTVLGTPKEYQAANQCQAVCQQTATPQQCTAFSFKAPNECTLFNSPTAQSSTPGTVSGPAFCPQPQAGAQSEQVAALGALAPGLASAGSLLLPGAAAPLNLAGLGAGLASSGTLVGNVAANLPGIVSTSAKALSTGLGAASEVAKYVDLAKAAELVTLARDNGVFKRLPVSNPIPDLKMQSLPPQGSGKPKIDCFKQGMKCCIPLAALNGRYEGRFAPAFLSGTEQCSATLSSDIFSNPNDFGGDVCATAVFKGEGNCGMRVYDAGPTKLYENELRHRGANNNVICRCWLTKKEDGDMSVKGEATWEVTVQAANGRTGEGAELGALGQAGGLVEFLGSEEGQAALSGAGQLLNQVSGTPAPPGARPVADMPVVGRLDGAIDAVNAYDFQSGSFADTLRAQSVDEVDTPGGKVAVTLLTGTREGVEDVKDYVDSQAPEKGSGRRLLQQVDAPDASISPKCSAWLWANHVYARRSHCEEAPLEYQAVNEQCAPVELVKDGCPATDAVNLRMCALSCGLMCFKMDKLRWWDAAPYRLHTEFITYPSVPALRANLETRCPDFLDALLQSNDTGILPMASLSPQRRQLQRRQPRWRDAREKKDEGDTSSPTGPPSLEDLVNDGPLDLLPAGDIPSSAAADGTSFVELVSDLGNSVVALVAEEDLPLLKPSPSEDPMASLANTFGAFLGASPNATNATDRWAGLFPEGAREELGIVTFNQMTGVIMSAIVDEGKNVVGPVLPKKGWELAEVLARPELIRWRYDVPLYTFSKVMEFIPSPNDDGVALDLIQREQLGLTLPQLDTRS